MYYYRVESVNAYGKSAFFAARGKPPKTPPLSSISWTEEIGAEHLARRIGGRVFDEKHRRAVRVFGVGAERDEQVRGVRLATRHGPRELVQEARGETVGAGHSQGEKQPPLPLCKVYWFG